MTTTEDPKVLEDSINPYGLGKEHDIVRDPIYGYIDFSKDIEKPVIDSDFVQRLRRIRQTQTSYLVYPGADHTRMQHSLGVMHLAGLMTSSILRDYMSWGSVKLEISPTLLIQIARFGGLLHDIGHGPMSHAFEETVLSRFYEDYPDYKIKDHEEVGMRMIESSPLTTILLDIQKKLPEEIQNQIASLDKRLPNSLPSLIREFMKPSMPVLKKMPVFSAISRVLRGHVSVDIIDFLRRDSYFCGTLEYGSVDYQRLARTTFLGIRNESVFLATSNRSMETFRTLLFQRYQMFNNVYYHRTVRKASKMIKHLFDLAYETLELDELLANVFSSPNNWQPYLLLDDSSFLGMLGTVTSLKSYDLLWSEIKDPIKFEKKSHMSKNPSEKRKRMKEIRQALARRDLEWSLLMECIHNYEKAHDVEVRIGEKSSFFINNLPFTIDQTFSLERFEKAVLDALGKIIDRPERFIGQKPDYNNSIIFDVTRITAAPDDGELTHDTIAFRQESNKTVFYQNVSESGLVYPPLERMRLLVFMQTDFTNGVIKNKMEEFETELECSIKGMKTKEAGVNM